MNLVEKLERLAAKEESLFRTQLLREDIARLKRLQTLAGECSDFAAFTKAGMRIGWTQGDARTQELAAPLEQLLGLVYQREMGFSEVDLDSDIESAWEALHRMRMERLVGCLSTPAPKPGDSET